MKKKSRQIFRFFCLLNFLYQYIVLFFFLTIFYLNQIFLHIRLNIFPYIDKEDNKEVQHIINL